MKTTSFQVHLAPKVYGTWESWWPLEHNNLWHKGMSHYHMAFMPHYGMCLQLHM